jgi:hypothetical protein
VEDIVTDGGRDKLPVSIYIDDIFIFGDVLEDVLA